MALPIGHGLVGASIVALIHPKADLKNWKPLAIGFLLANSPDLDFAFQIFLGWRGWHRGFTHSILFALLVGAIFFLIMRREKWQIPLSYSLAYLSHTILDFATSDIGAVRLFAPLDKTPYSLGLVRFFELQRGLVITDMLYISAIEVLIFVPLFLLTLFVARRV